MKSEVEQDRFYICDITSLISDKIVIEAENRQGLHDGEEEQRAEGHRQVGHN